MTTTGPSEVGVPDGLVFVVRGALLGDAEVVAIELVREDSRLGDVVIGGSEAVVAGAVVVDAELSPKTTSVS